MVAQLTYVHRLNVQLPCASGPHLAAYAALRSCTRILAPDGNDYGDQMTSLFNSSIKPLRVPAARLTQTIEGGGEDQDATA